MLRNELAFLSQVLSQVTQLSVSVFISFKVVYLPVEGVNQLNLVKALLVRRERKIKVRIMYPLSGERQRTQVLKQWPDTTDGRRKSKPKNNFHKFCVGVESSNVIRFQIPVHSLLARGASSLPTDQKIRAEANRVAPRSCLASAAFLFSRLDSFGSGLVELNKFEDFCARLLGLPDSGSYAESYRNPRKHRGDTSQKKRGSCKASTASHVSVFADVQSQQPPLLPNDERRLRRIFAVIARSVWVNSASRHGLEHRRNDRSSHGSYRLSGNSSSRLLYSSKLRQTHNSNDDDSVSTDSSTSGGSKHQCDEGVISLESFCRFVEGKKFGAASNLEGFLRALAGAGRALLGRQEDATQLRQVGAAASRLAFHMSDKTSSRTVVGAPTVSRPDTPGARSVQGSAHWGGGRVRRTSAQFSSTLQPQETKTQYVTGGRMIPASTRLFWSSRDRPAGRTIKDGPTPRRNTSRGESATARLIGNTNSARSSSAGTAYSSTSTKASRAGLPGGLGVVLDELSGWDHDGSGAVSATELVSAMGQGVGIPLRLSWAEALVERFEAKGMAIEAVKDGLRGSGSARGKLDVIAFVEFLRLKTFSISVMTPFGKCDC